MSRVFSRAMVLENDPQEIQQPSRRFTAHCGQFLGFKEGLAQKTGVF